MTDTLLKMFLMSRSRLINLLPGIKETDLPKRLNPESNSIGFLLRHIGEVEQLFAKNVFGLDIKVTANTIGKTKDIVRFNDLKLVIVIWLKMFKKKPYLHKNLKNGLITSQLLNLEPLQRPKHFPESSRTERTTAGRLR